MAEHFVPGEKGFAAKLNKLVDEVNDLRTHIETHAAEDGKRFEFLENEVIPALHQEIADLKAELDTKAAKRGPKTAAKNE